MGVQEVPRKAASPGKRPWTRGERRRPAKWAGPIMLQDWDATPLSFPFMVGDGVTEHFHVFIQ